MVEAGMAEAGVGGGAACFKRFPPKANSPLPVPI